MQKFQSPAEEIIPIPSTSKARTKEDTELIHKKGSFLAVRGDEGLYLRLKIVLFSFSPLFRVFQYTYIGIAPDKRGYPHIFRISA